MTENCTAQSLVESECHFLLSCTGYDRLRHAWLDKLNLPQSFYSLEDTEKIHTLLNDVSYVKHTAQFIVDAFNLRSKLIYLGGTR